ncbi:hypothetical protein Y10_09290 [Neptunitalea sp. Y10]|uniref:DUF4198 domain-containing protein n=2 Tax=Neptunitalea lumnitzerae TaxID=2965509 RepID=A0ABQ5MGK4_9FLAO|nr:hypothetical protein Y10_09290 [Neptunitalea sp. Y10]
MWIETNAIGNKDKEHIVKVHYGEYSYGVYEEVGGDTFNKVKNFTLWLVAPDGTKEVLEVSPEANFYKATFKPSQKGVYTVLLDNNDIEVIDFTKYDFGIFKTHYHSATTIDVGSGNINSVADNASGIAVKRVEAEKGKVKFQVLYKGTPLAKNEVAIYMADQWSKKLTTDDEGYITFTLPFNTQYVLETTIKEEVPGVFRGKAYEFIWHCATYTILNN